MVSGLAAFFSKMIEKSRTVQYCENKCGTRLQLDHWEIAHIIAKGDRQNPEVATCEDNIVHLCRQCHHTFDRSLSIRQTMEVFPLSVERFKKFEDQIIKKTKEVQMYQNYE